MNPLRKGFFISRRLLWFTFKAVEWDKKKVLHNKTKRNKIVLDKRLILKRWCKKTFQRFLLFPKVTHFSFHLFSHPYFGCHLGAVTLAWKAKSRWQKVKYSSRSTITGSKKIVIGDTWFLVFGPRGSLEGRVWKWWRHFGKKGLVVMGESLFMAEL